MDVNGKTFIGTSNSSSNNSSSSSGSSSGTAGEVTSSGANKHVVHCDEPPHGMPTISMPVNSSPVLENHGSRVGPDPVASSYRFPDADPHNWRHAKAASSASETASRKDILTELGVSGDLKSRNTLACSQQLPVSSSSRLLSNDRIAVHPLNDVAVKSSDCMMVTTSASRTSPYIFSGTRHQSYGNLGISSGVAGLSSTSANLALLPLRASSDASKSVTVAATTSTATTTTMTAVTSPHTVVPVQHLTSSSPTSVPPESSRLDPTVSTDRQSRSGLSTNTAAELWDRRSSFFSEPPKPVSLPPNRTLNACFPLMSTATSSSSTELTKHEACMATSPIFDPDEIGRSPSLTSALCDDLFKLSMSCDTAEMQQLPHRRHQQLPPPQTPAIQVLPGSPALLQFDNVTATPLLSLSVQRDAAVMLPMVPSRESPDFDLDNILSSKSTASRMLDDNPSSVWYQMTPHSRMSRIDPSFWDPCL